MTDWQKQNFSKNGGASAPMQMNQKLLPSGSAAGLHKKIAAPSYGMGGLVMSKSPGAKSVPRFADGTPGGVKFDQGEFAGVDEAVAKQSEETSNSNPYQGDDTDPFSGARNDDGSIKQGSSESAAADDGAAMPKTFKEAFAKNRADGKKTFEFGGKSFTTELASEKPAKTAARPVVSSRTKTPAIDSGDEPSTSRKVNQDTTAKPVLAKSASTYETPYDRMNRQNREMESAREETKAETDRLAKRVPVRGRGVIDTSNINSNTLLPRR